MAKKDKSAGSADPETKADGAQKKAKTKEPDKSMFREVAEVLMYGLSLLIFCKGFVWQNFQIPTSSMENSLLIGDHITANTFMFKNAGPLERAVLPYRDVKRGDVIVFKFPGAPREDWIKRCIGVPGDTYEVVNHRVFLNGNAMDEPYAFYKDHMRPGVSTRCADIGYRPCDYYTLKPGLENGTLPPSPLANVTLDDLINKTYTMMDKYRTLDPEAHRRIIDRLDTARQGDQVTIPEGFYLMMGDNRNNSHDSRAWGLVPHELVEGRAYFLWWSYGEDEGSHELRGWPWLKSYLRVPIEFFRRTHWKETFTRIK